MNEGSSNFDLSPEQIQSIRFSGEHIYATQFATLTPALLFGEADPAKIRRALLARSLLLSEGMAPAPYAVARLCAQRLGVTETVELYQAAGAENAAMHLCRSPVLLEIQGRLLPLLDESTLAALMGHEFGHYLAHGSAHPHAAAARASRRLLLDESAPDEMLDVARRLSMAMELTADRFGLLACRDLQAALRLEMVVVTGLSANELTWDTQAYLEQSKSLIEGLLEHGETATGHSHPEHSLRTYALWLFSESDLYRNLTGLGPGTRPIKEVDEQLLAILGRPEVSLGSAAAFEEPQVEVQECALAACVLVAAADGEIHDAEIQAIEKVFAHLLPQWRDLLEPDEALSRFQQLAPILYATGPRAQRALFALLTHVLAADGECAPDEIDQILAIGSALGCLGLFRSLLPAVIAASALSVDIVVEAPARSIPMPAEARQARAALQVYFDRVARRGGDTVTPRRLLRLMGAAKNTSPVRREIEALAASAGLHIEPSLDEQLDAFVRLEPVSGKAAPEALRTVPIENPASTTVRLRKAVTRLRDKLVSGDGRSPSIRLRVPRLGRAFDLHQLEEVSTGLAERALTMLTSGGSITVLEGSETDSHEGSRRVLNNLVALDRERQSRVEETGADELYLGYPFLTGLVNGYLLRGPLILYPATLSRNRGHVQLRATGNETPIANQALLRLLLRQKQLAFPETLVEESDAAAETGTEALLGILDRLGIKLVPKLGQLSTFSDRNQELDTWRDDRLEIEDCAVLGLFPQSSSDLLHDYDDLLTQLQSGLDPASLLACAGEVFPAEIKSIAQGEWTASASESPPIPAIHADPVQRSVLALARSKRALVVDGPPGTGKSQVIVNLIADALLHGEKVAVVCEKRAALDVVVNRLDTAGFRHLLALVHDVHEDRRELYQQVVKRIEPADQIVRPPVSVPELHAELARLEQPLLAFSERLLQSKSGISLGQAYAYASGLDVPSLPTIKELSTLDVGRIPRLSDAFQALAPFADLWRPGSLWSSPRPEASRKSFAELDLPQSDAIRDTLLAAHRTRTAFEAACDRAQATINNETLGRILAAKTGLDTAVASRAARQRAGDVDYFLDAFAAARQSPDSLKLVGATLEALECMEKALHAAGLVAGEESRALLAQAQIPLGAVREVLQASSSALARDTLSACLREGSGMALLSDTIDQQTSQWRQNALAATAAGCVVDWADSPDLLAAATIVQRTHGSFFRLFIPAWWKARKHIRGHLSQYWPEKAGEAIDPALLQQIEQRRSAALAWDALKTLFASVSTTAIPASAAEATGAIQDILSARDHASLIEQAQPALSILGMWPAPKSSIGWQAWAQRIDALLAAVSAMTVAEGSLRRLQDLLPRSELNLSAATVARVQHVARFVSSVFAARSALTSVDAWPNDLEIPSAMAAWDGRLDALVAVIRSLAELKTATAAVQPLLPWYGMGTPSERWAALVGAWQTDARRLAESDRLLEEVTSLYASSRALLVSLAGSTTIRTDQWAECVLKTWTLGIVAELDANPSGSLSERLSLEHEEEQAAIYRHHCERASTQIVLAALAVQDENSWIRTPAAAKGARRTDVQAIKEAMLREARKQRSLLPLRTFVRRYVHQGLLEALPVWLLSPETMAQLFPREACFDLVILDEASQCTVESGLPVLMRAKRVVIAGDERQMPPSNFFKVTSDEDSTTTDDEGQVPKDVLDEESLLVLARSRVAHTGLAWHYRCQQEELIAFSNHAIYNGGLKTIPSVMSRTATAAMYWHAVTDAHYEEGVNLDEARSVVTLITRIMSRPNPPTVGVVTFNLGQRKAILDMIDQAKATDVTFAALYGREMARERVDERPFVKNLENVQGDERDVIVFSLGHAPRERLKRDGKRELYVPARFGPVGLRGGERRLNVAVSRAKQEVHVVSSFTPAMLSVASSKNAGPRLFKGFLEFASAIASGQRNEAERVLDLMRGTPRHKSALPGRDGLPMYVPLKAQLMLALEREGLQCELDVGASDFRVPLAVVDPSDRSRYLLALLFSEGDQIEWPVEAHLHVPLALRQRGWRVLRINARDWARQPERIVKLVKARLISES